MNNRKGVGKQDTAEYTILRCEVCGMLHVIHRKMTADGFRCRDCGGGPLRPMGHAIMLGQRADEITVKVNVDTSELDKLQRRVDELNESTSRMFKRLIGVRGEMRRRDDTDI